MRRLTLILFVIIITLITKSACTNTAQADFILPSGIKCSSAAAPPPVAKRQIPLRRRVQGDILRLPKNEFTSFFSNRQYITSETPSAFCASYSGQTQSLPLLHYPFADVKTIEKYNAKAPRYSAGGAVLTSVVPHHLVAGSLIAGFFAAARQSRADIETIIIIAPMHHKASGTLYTTLSDWAAPFGVMENERVFSQAFVDSLGAQINDEVITGDHSAAELLSFAQNYFPNAKTAVLLISSMEDIGIARRTAELLADFAGQKDCLFVFSADFSHYLEPKETNARDEQTREAVLMGDTETIGAMTDANVDFPRGLIAFIELNKLLGADTAELDNSNSLKVSNLPPDHPLFDEGLTSYFVFVGVNSQSG